MSIRIATDWNTVISAALIGIAAAGLSFALALTGYYDG
jgi:hypothetical protein